jgi:hypothetical protein
LMRLFWWGVIAASASASPRASSLDTTSQPQEQCSHFHHVIQIAV